MKSDNFPKVSLSALFFIFLKLGCISFGGPAAHLVLFNRTFVDRLKWLSSHEYGQLVALAQLLPGPTSSQVGLSIGYLSKGYWGGFIAWLGFTLPAFILMTSFAIFGQYFFSDIPLELFHVIHLIVIAVVIWAFLQMFKSFCTEIWQYVLMLSSAFFIYFAQWSYSQIFLILVAGFIGLAFTKKGKSQPSPHIKTTQAYQKYHYLWLILFVTLFIIFPALQFIYSSSLLRNLESFYHTASMVFGGGHIILPLMYEDFVLTQHITAEQFDLGYAFAQVIPGPLFSFAGYVGTYLGFTASPLLNAAIATSIIFLPSFLLIFGTLPYWSKWVKNKKIAAAVAAINAAVIGLLLCLIAQMAEKHLHSIYDFIFIGIVILLLRSKIPVIISLVASFVSYGALLYFVI